MSLAVLLKEENPLLEEEVLGRPLYYFPHKEVLKVFSRVLSPYPELSSEPAEFSSPQEALGALKGEEGLFFLFPSFVGIFAEEIIQAMEGGSFLFLVDGEIAGGYLEKAQGPSEVQRKIELDAIRVEDRASLVDALSLLRFRKIEESLSAGAMVMDPATTWLWEDVELRQGAVVEPFVIMKGKIVVEEGVVIKASSYLENPGPGVMRIRRGAQVGPFSRIRLDADIGEEARIGNFVEVKKSLIGARVKAQHLTYIGDAEVGEDSNIGAGTITCNYDGFRKNRTVIGKRVFVGSGVELVAPVELEDDSFVAAGSTITKKVPRFSLAIARARQENKEGWVLKKRKEWERKSKS